MQTLIEKPEETLDGAKVLKKVMGRCLLITFTFHRWRGNYQIEDSEMLKEGKKIPKSLTTPGRWKLIPKDVNEKFNTLEAEARNTLAKYSVPFSMHGVYIVPISKADELFTKLKAIRDKLDDYVSNLYSDEAYAAILEEIEKEVGSNVAALESIKKVFPSKEEIKKKYGIVWAIAPIGSPNVDFEDPSEFIQEAREATNKLVMNSVESMLTQPRKEVADAINNLLELLEKNKKGSKGSVRKASLDNIKEAFDKLRSFSFLADDALLEAMKDAEEQLDIEPKKLNSDAAAAENLSKVLRAISEVAENNNATIETFNRFTRGIDFDMD